MGGVYNQQTAGEKSFLAAHVERFQFDQRFSPSKQNQIVPALVSPNAELQFVVARLLRMEVCSHVHVAYM